MRIRQSLRPSNTTPARTSLCQSTNRGGPISSVACEAVQALGATDVKTPDESSLSGRLVESEPHRP
eukprot:scaffold15874_cov150-Isochrysis_galbana.AAC.5